jgi:putative beta-lysine N-acetyltransferase
MVDAASDVLVPDVEERLTGNGFAAEVLVSGLNARIQVTDYRAVDPVAMAAALEERAVEAGVDKVFVKAMPSDREALEEGGMSAEAVIEGYYNGRPAVVMSTFLSDDRRRQAAAREQEVILAGIRERPPDPSLVPLPDGYRMRRAQPDDATDLAGLYADVFRSYPYPIDDPEYIEATMAGHVVYRLVRNPAGEVVAAASAETDLAHANAEMTDFATLPDQRGLGLAQHLLAALERDMEEGDIPNLYTVARARSAGMNRVFYNRGYRRTGTLVNNCHIAGSFEDMHVWCKQIAANLVTGDSREWGEPLESDPGEPGRRG